MHTLIRSLVPLALAVTHLAAQAPPAPFAVPLGWGGDPTSSSMCYDAAYDAVSDLYCVVTASGDASGGVLRVARFHSDGSPYGPTMPIASTAGRFGDVTIANVRRTGTFVIAWQETVGSTHSIKAMRFVAPRPGPDPAALVIASATGAVSPYLGPHLAGDPSGQADAAILVWRHASGIVNVTIRTDGPLRLENVHYTARSANAGRPRISRAPDVGTGAVRYCVVWTDRHFSPVLGAYQRDVHAALVGTNGADIGAQLVVSTSEVVDDTAPDVDGDGRDFLVTWERGQLSSSTRRDIVCRRLAVVADQLTVAGPESAVASSFLRDERAPRVSWFGEKYVVTWQRETSELVTWCGAQGTAPIAAARRYENKVTSRMARDGAVGGPYSTLDSGLFPTGRPAAPIVVAERTGAEGLGDGGLIFWQEQCIEHVSGTLERSRYTAFATFHAAFGGGAVVDLGGGCGNGGALAAREPFAIGYPDFTIGLTGADPGAQLAILHVADNSAATSCGPCLLTPATYGSLVLPVANGAMSLTLPLGRSPSWLGVEIVWQVGVLSARGGPCAWYPELAMTNRLLTTYGW